MEKEIEGYSGYYITDDGKVISRKYSSPRIMKTWYQKSGYENIKLCENNITHHHLIHRLVAEAFVPNPDNLPEVNHKNKNRQDNRAENLEWCNRLDNLYDSYETMLPVRNYCECYLTTELSNEPIKYFQSIAECARYASDVYGCSQSGMERNHKSKGFKIEYGTCND